MKISLQNSFNLKHYINLYYSYLKQFELIMTSSFTKNEKHSVLWVTQEFFSLSGDRNDYKNRTTSE